MGNNITGILIGEGPTCEEARSMTCPYCALYYYSDNTIVGVFSIPPHHRWWLEWIEKKPRVAGLTTAEVFFTEKVNAHSPWSLGQVKAEMEKAPCGSDCETCKFYQKECEGCPSTKYYLL
ncbi:MAG: hypothetical protein PVF58_13475 [Candidatus Methanofastidiosia archaeon]|jgi:hypothetical protein